ncbi:lipocalin family protein [Falsiroseomonas sp.]|uniref:lipocalin family protein n=1 Tax=Falsiroseomonas sp. TaxID=2870721 RepID=UPI0027239D68|nr:lipocalin family protein [Falsiroseomonas sp.]MDO9500409.1 lipocalin family protein [Falsiroseomonas sp.]MDP3418138.1 lipocalin family protein [Falsiroseomonas sp.]
MRRFLLLAVLLLGACATTPARPPVATVPQVDLARYAGTWFEIARFPNSFQDSARGCTHTTATYTPRPDGTIGVVNRCRGADGSARVAEGSAYVVPESGNAKLRVTFFWPFYGDYWVIGLDPSYRWAVVGAPGRDYLWVLARRPELAPGDYAEAVITAAGQGFEISRLRPTPQE